tara:strand:- start:808 stop:1200 length:393 start_codon:yes stop_codon:yes gene_type:complete
MYQNVFAAVNEIFIYGQPITSNAAKSVNERKAETISTIEPIFNTDKIKLYPNPVNEKLNVKFPIHLMGKSNVVIRDMIGKTLYNKDVIIGVKNPILELNNYQLPKTNGMYMLSLLHESGELITLKFIRKN